MERQEDRGEGAEERALEQWEYYCTHWGIGSLGEDGTEDNEYIISGKMGSITGDVA